MAESRKPFSSDETQRILHHLQQPAVFMNMTCGWPVLHWTAEHLSGCFGDKLLQFRLGRKEEIDTPLFETQCSYVEAKLRHFLNWTRDASGRDVGPFIEYPYSEYWAYADYKYIAVLFQDQPSMFEDVKWSEFGFEGRNGRESTLWIGTEGANTPCHLDTYGCNLVLQVQGRPVDLRTTLEILVVKSAVKQRDYSTCAPISLNINTTWSCNRAERRLIIYSAAAVFLHISGGRSFLSVNHPDLPQHERKRWHLFSPEDTANLYPTRIPYEESSVFSQVNVPHPDLRRFPAFQRARAHIVTVQPGQVLYVPRHWWHYVESVDPITVSVNSWIELEVDDVARVSESVTKAVVCAIKSAQSDDNAEDWLNPTEEGVTSHNENMQYVNLAVRACAQRQMNVCHSKLSQGLRDTHQVKRESSEQIRKNRSPVRDSAPFSVPFGPHLIPVCCQHEDPAETKGKSPGTSRKSAGKFVGDCSSHAVLGTEPTSAVSLHRGNRECSPGFTQSRDCADVASSSHTTITTNDLLDCLVHPDIINRVTELLLERHSGSHRTTTSS